MRYLFPILFLVLTLGLGAQARLSGDLDFSVKAEDGVPSTREIVTFSALSSWIDFKLTQSINSDGRYGADIANFKDSQSFFDNYLLMEEGYTTVRFNPVEFQVGRIRHQDAFDSPYSLFVNSRNPSAVGAVLSYKDPIFTYESRWIRLNERSDLGSNAPPAWNESTGADGRFPDRGANLKTLTFTLGHQKFGIQDAGVYTGRSFDLEYFVSPMPEYFTQYFYGTGGRPWTTSSNENNLIGFFWVWEDTRFKLDAQVLLDDFSLHFLFPDKVPNNPWKAAWTIGASMPTWAGTFGIHHAGALKYTFEPIDDTLGSEALSAYGYSLYPDTSYGVAGTQRAFLIEDNALGYLHGENNLAVMLTWDQVWNKTVKVASNVEFLVAGANSPANPWQDATSSNEVGTHWIDDPVLQQSVVWTTDLRWTNGPWVFYLGAKIGGVWNALKLEAPDPAQAHNSSPGDSGRLDEYVKIYKPSGDRRFVSMLELGVSYQWDISSGLAWLKTRVP